jgi:hypothetical protein
MCLRTYFRHDTPREGYVQGCSPEMAALVNEIILLPLDLLLDFGVLRPSDDHVVH